jgi:hypothetical protein
MIQIVQQTKEEKIAMYMKCTKKELSEMLVNCNILLEKIGPIMVTKEQIKNHGDPNFRRTV